MGWQHVVAWGGFLILVLAMLTIDLFVLHRKPHAINMREAALGTLVPVVGALAFMAVVYLGYQNHWLDLGRVPGGVPAKDLDLYPTSGPDAAIAFLTGYVVELSLSADNVFLFVVLMGFFKVPQALQHRVLFWGVLGALVMRAALILAGASLLAKFHWLIYLFGAFILYAGVRMFFSDAAEADPGKSWAVRMARRLLPLREGYEGGNFFVREGGRTLATTLLLVLVSIELTDLVFALDSIPAIFGITRDAFIVFTSNVFAILGLRSMYFLLAGVIDRFHYLKLGLSGVLTFVGVKMVLPGLGTLYGMAAGGEHDWHVDKYVSLGVILALLGLSVAASLIWPRKEHVPQEQAGRVRAESRV